MNENKKSFKCFLGFHDWTKWSEIESETVHHAYNVIGPMSEELVIERQTRTCRECNMKQIRYFYPLGKKESRA